MGMITEIKPEPRNNFIDGVRPRGYVHWEILDEDDNIIERGYGVGSQWWLKYIPNFLHRFLPYGKQNAIVDTSRKRITDWVAGGSAPATTDSGVDIFSFYWDATNQKCYGVGSLNFGN